METSCRVYALLLAANNDPFLYGLCVQYVCMCVYELGGKTETCRSLCLSVHRSGVDVSQVSSSIAPSLFTKARSLAEPEPNEF